MLALEEEGFKFNCLISDKLADDGSCKGRTLEQVFFLTDAQIVYSKRFIANYILLVNGTFETNKLSIVLLVIIGVIITNKNFSTIYSFIYNNLVHEYKKCL